VFPSDERINPKADFGRFIRPRLRARQEKGKRQALCHDSTRLENQDEQAGTGPTPLKPEARGGSRRRASGAAPQPFYYRVT
jgi:hypothetical protein